MNKLVREVVVVVICAAIFALMPMFLLGQASPGKIVGTVKDPEGAIVNGVDVYLLNPLQAVIRTTATDASGNFTLDNIAPGDYEIRVTPAGFAPYRASVLVTPGGTKELSVMLGMKPLSEEVTVTAEAGQVVDVRNIDTPVNVINEKEILERATEVVAQAVDEETGVNLQRTSPSLSAVFVRGLTGRNVAVYVDGVRYTTSAQRGGVGTFFSLIEPSSLETVEILRGPNSSQYGSDVHGGVVNFISRSPKYGGGDGEFHGSTNLFYSSPTNGFGGNSLFSYGTRRYGLLLNMNGRRINRLRPADGIESHAAVTRYLGLLSNVFGERLADTAFTQYGGLLPAHLHFDCEFPSSSTIASQQPDGGRRYGQFLGGEGDLLASLANLFTDVVYARLFKQDLGIFDNGSVSFSYNAEREERIHQNGHGNPVGAITNQRERTRVLGFNFYLDKKGGERNTFLLGGDVYRDKITAPAFTYNQVTKVTTNSRPRIPNEALYLS